MALLKVTNDLQLTLDSGGNVNSVAFDTEDHNILLARLEQWVDTNGRALHWFSSYLKHRTFSVSLVQFPTASALSLMEFGPPKHTTNIILLAI